MNTLVLVMEADSHKPMLAKDHGNFDSFQEPGEANGLSPLPAGRVSLAATSDLSIRRGYELWLSGAGMWWEFASVPMSQTECASQAYLSWIHQLPGEPGLWPKLAVHAHPKAPSLSLSHLLILPLAPLLFSNPNLHCLSTQAGLPMSLLSRAGHRALD